MEGAVRKAVDREHVEIVLGEQALQRGQGAVGELAGGARGQPEADAERRVGADLRLDRDDVTAEVRLDLGPRLTGVDVGAVRQVGAGDLHRHLATVTFSTT